MNAALACQLARLKSVILILFIVQTSGLGGRQNGVGGQQQHQPRLKPSAHVPSPLQSASYISLDGLTLVVAFDKPVNLSASIESVEQRIAAASSAFEGGGDGENGENADAASESAPARLRLCTSNNLQQQADKKRLKQEQQEQDDCKQHYKSTRRLRPKVSYSSSSRRRPRGGAANDDDETSRRKLAGARPVSELLRVAASDELGEEEPQTCQRDELQKQQQQLLTPHVIGGIQLCAQLLTRKSLRLLHKFHPRNCLWASQVQFLIQLGRPVKLGAAGAAASQAGGNSATPATLKIAFRRGTLSEQGQWGTRWNEQETSVELAKLPLEGLGVPLAPRLALTGPNQVPPCGQFALSAHLSSPYGTQADEAVKLQWSVERIGVAAPAGLNSSGPQNATARAGGELSELRWRHLQQLVSSQRGNNLVLEAQLLEFAPQLYEFRLQAAFVTSLTSFTLNATHRVGRLELEAPIGTLYGTHLLNAERQLNTNQDLALMADIQVPECAQNIKQVGLYWQVSDPRVRFEQTYAPVYVAKAGSLPEQALVEFRLNLFYGIRVRKFASASALVPTGDSVLEAQISDGLLMASLTAPRDAQRNAAAGAGGQAGESELELFAVSRAEARELQENKYTFQWSCFDGKTAQPCQKSLRVLASSGAGDTRYDIGQTESQAAARRRAQLLARPQLQPADNDLNNQQQQQQQQATSLLLIDRSRQRQPILRLPLSWLEADAQLWFGLQRFERHQPSQHSKTEYALVSVQPAPSALPSAAISIGPVLIGRARQRASLRNPLTGAILALANTQTIIVGRLSGGGGQTAARANSSEPVHAFKWHIPNYLHPLHWTSRSTINPLNGQRETLTELHLSAELMLAHAHHLVQLSVCAGAQAASVASISLDMVQGVSECRVEMQAAPSAGAGATLQAQAHAAQLLPLVVAVNYCNIPLGLSPLTYQLYAVDTSAADAFVESNRPQRVDKPAGGERDVEEEQANEADELHYESQAQPLSVPQLSPVFALGNLNALALMALLQPPAEPSANGSGAELAAGARPVRLRFGARVCNRLQSCQMFYSSSLDPLALLAPAPGELAPAGGGGQNRSLALQLERGLAPSAAALKDAGGEQAVRALAGMLEGAKRANLAGNSIAAVSVLNALMALGERLLERQASFLSQRRPLLAGANKQRQNYRPANGSGGGGEEAEREGDQSGGASGASPTAELERARAPLDAGQLARLRDLLQTSMRDCLSYGAQSIQRQFHYTEPGETNVALLAIGRLLRLAGVEQWELKYRAMRLMALLLRKSLEQSTGGASGGGDQRLPASLPDFKSLQAAYESLFSTFGQHSLDGPTTATPLLTPAGKHLAKRHNSQRGGGGEAVGERKNGSPQDNGGRVGGGGGANRPAGGATGGAQPESGVEYARDNSSFGALPPARPQQWRARRAVAPVHSNNDILQHRDGPQSALGGTATTKTTTTTTTTTTTATSTATITATTSGAAAAADELMTPAASAPTPLAGPAAAAGGLRPTSATRRNREEAVLAYLRLVRHAHRALLQAAAAQLPLGAVQQFEYDSRQHSSGAPLALLAQPAGGGGDSAADNNRRNQQQQQHQQASSIVSSLAHQTDLLSDTIDVDLHEFGAVSLRFVAANGAPALRQLARKLSQSHVRCRNDSAQPQTKCSSFVLALTSFAGKAPFRSLDSLAPGARRPSSPSGGASRGHHQQQQARPGARAPLLRVPVVQIDWLSPLDGSSLTELLRQDQATAAAPGAPTLADFKAVVTFTLPPAPPAPLTSAASAGADNGARERAPDANEAEEQQAAATDGGADSNNGQFKCYQFAEAANEWVEVEQQQQQQQPPLPLRQGAPPDELEAEAEEAGARKIRCTFDGFGVVGAFQGRPPASEASVETKIALGLAACLALVAILSLLGCLASNWKAKQRRRRAAKHQRRPAPDDLDGTSRSNDASSSFESDYTTSDRRQAPARRL